MKQAITLLATGLLTVSTVNALVLVQDDFSYPDGPLVGNTPSVGGTWANHSGTANDLLVSGGTVQIQHGTPSEDANTTFAGGALTSGTIFYALDFSVSSSNPIGSNGEYFAHLKSAGTAFNARLSIEVPNSSGDFSVAVSAGSAPDGIWATDLTFDTVYNAVVGYDFSTGQSTLWVDPVDMSSTNVSTTTADIEASLSQFAFRQSDSTANELIVADNLRVATTFNEAIPEPSTYAAIAGLMVLGLALYRRRK